MTTQVHVVNFGPDVVVVEGPTTAHEIYPYQSANFYVYDGHNITIKEKQETPNDHTQERI